MINLGLKMIKYLFMPFLSWDWQLHVDQPIHLMKGLIHFAVTVAYSGGRVSLSTGCQVEWGEKETGPELPHLLFFHCPFSACLTRQFSFSPHTPREPVHRLGEGHKDLDLPKYCISIRSACSELPQVEYHTTAGTVRVWV